MSEVQEEIKALSWDFGYQDNNVIVLYNAETFNEILDQVKLNYNKANPPTNRSTYVIVNHYDKIQEDIYKLYTKITTEFEKKGVNTLKCTLNGVAYSKMIGIDYFPYRTIYIFEE